MQGNLPAVDLKLVEDKMKQPDDVNTFCQNDGGGKLASFSIREERYLMRPMDVQLDSRRELQEDPGNSVTQWISALKQGDQSAAQGLW